MADDLDDIIEDDDLTSFLDEDDDEDDTDLTSFLDEEEEEEEEEDSLSSFLEEEEEEEEEEDSLSSFLEEEEDDDEEDEDEMEYEMDDGDDGLLSSFFGDKKKKTKKTESEEGGFLDGLSGKPDPVLPYKKEKRKARLDITKTSKKTPKDVMRFTKKELNDRIKKEYKYMLGKPYMSIQPILIMADYPYKKKKSDSDEINDDNVEYDYAMVFGKQLKWRSRIDYKKKPHRIGEIMYMKRGVYWFKGDEVAMDPHFAIIVHKTHKRIKFKRIRDLFAPLKQRLRSGKPFEIYKEFPILIKRTGAFS